jgi:hypothetical protein
VTAVEHHPSKYGQRLLSLASIHSNQASLMALVVGD